MTSPLLPPQGTPAHFRFLPWNAEQPPERWLASSPAWRARYGLDAEDMAVSVARQKAMQMWIQGK